ncbi:MAG: c-type cytochrome biogenesis protein CcmI [Methylocystaceae bacterium]|jgi:cytochrome c-type biogenesis protein CcmH|nr:c-type cytochrome biogenesis protein CcmI [Methylocystaceae bacterium]NBT96902.1 c-type cytochrome biogenesis protein CcmI [Methylocystaceae bacterium]
MIWIFFALLTGAAVMAILAPLARSYVARDEKTADLAFFENQISEINHDLAQGRLLPEDAEIARAEAARRLLRQQSLPATHVAQSRKLSVAAALFAIVFVPAIAIGFYLYLGDAQLEDMPLAARLKMAPNPTDLAGAVARIERHLIEHPDDGRGYEVVAPYLLRTGRGEDAVRAYAEALRLLGPTAERYAALGEARTIVAQGRVSPLAQQDFEAAVGLDPNYAMANYYLGLSAMQTGSKDKAIEIFTKLIEQAPPNAPYLEAVKSQLDLLRGVAPGNDPSQAIAQLPDQERAKVIRGMVDRLAARLTTKGNDVEGWVKLIRAYRVLSENEKAQQAIKDARKALAGDKAALARIDALVKDAN